MDSSKASRQSPASTRQWPTHGKALWVLMARI